MHRAESVLQNCVMGRCAICIFMYCYKTNASEYGLGAALIQNNRPIAFASKTLTDIETRYANVERECLSVCYGLEKFHT